MSNVNICTSEDFYVDAIKVEMICWCCGKSAIHRIGWLAMECSNCKMEYSLDDSMSDIVKKIRIRLKLNRPQMAKLIGYSKHTIKKYEFDKCTYKYYLKMKELWRKKNESNKRNRTKNI